MRRLTLIALLLLGAMTAGAQQDWLYTMQALNLYDGNAAAAGMYERNALHLRYRHQWLGTEGAPQTLQATWHTALGAKLGWGVRMNAERIGAFDRSQAVTHLAYRLQLRKSELRFALGGGVGYERLATDRMNILDADDAVLSGDLDQLDPLAQFAFMWRSKRLFIGAEVNQWFSSERSWGTVRTSGRTREALVMAGSMHALNNDWSLRPMLAARWSDAGAFLPEAQLGAWWRETFWFGAGYRWDAAAYGFAEYRYRGKIRLAYSFGVPVNTIANPSQHELMIGLLWGGNRRRTVASSTYFQ